MLCARSRSTRLVRDRCSGLPFQDQGRDLCRARTRVPLFRGWLTPPLRRRPSRDYSSLPSQDLVQDTPCTARLRHGFVRSIARTTIGEGGGVWGSAGKKGISTFPRILVTGSPRSGALGCYKQNDRGTRRGDGSRGLPVAGRERSRKRVKNKQYSPFDLWARHNGMHAG